MRTKIIQPICIVVFLLIPFLEAFALPSTAEDFKVGALLNLTGFGALWGKNARQGIELARDEINAAGGINGKQLTVVFEDTRSGDLSYCASAAQKLVSTDKVKALLTQWTGDTEVAWPITSRQGVLTISLSAGAKGLTRNRPLLLNMWGEDTALLEETTRSLSTRNLKNIAIITVQDPYFLSLASAASQMLIAQGMTPTITREILPSTSQLRDEALRIKDAKIDAIVSLLYYPQQANLLTELEALRIKPLMYGVIGSDNEDFLKLAGRSAEGMLLPTYDLKSTVFVANFYKKWAENPWLSADTAYDAVKLLATLTERGNESGNELSKAARELQGYSGASGPVKFSSDGQRLERPTHLLQIKNGRAE